MDTRVQASGQWLEILPALGIDPKFLSTKHGPCPICGGKDRFRLVGDNRGTFFCNQCGNGDGFDLIRKVKGITNAEAFSEVNKLLQIKPKIDQASKEEDRRNRDAMNRVWGGAGRQKDGGPVSTYLENRTGLQWPFIAVREHPNLKHPIDGSKFPAMLAKVVDHKGNPTNLHITYLTGNGKKADVSKNKVFMAGKLPDGSCVRLMPHTGLLGIAEGIETALSASRIFDVPVWSACNASLLSKWMPPEDVQKVIIFGDNDQNFHGQAKAYALAHKLANQYKLKVKVMIPDRVGDWNDHLAAMERDH